MQLPILGNIVLNNFLFPLKFANNYFFKALFQFFPTLFRTFEINCFVLFLCVRNPFLPFSIKIYDYIISIAMSGKSINENYFRKNSFDFTEPDIFEKK